MTEIKRIALHDIQDLDSAIKNICDNMETGDFKLKATFVYQTELILVFQK